MIPDIRFLKQTLEDVGCDDRLISECIKIAETRPSAELLKPLCHYRAALLERLHESQEQFDCLDFLLYRIRENKF